MKKINELRFWAAVIFAVACVLIYVGLKFADAIDRLAEPENCEIEHDEDFNGDYGPVTDTFEFEPVEIIWIPNGDYFLDSISIKELYPDSNDMGLKGKHVVLTD